MRVLALDTTAERGSLALLDGDRLVEEQVLRGPDGFGHLLFPALTELLERHGWTLPQVDIFAAASGPGSFTGVRVGVSAVKGLAEATGRTVQAISNLRALAGQGTGERRLAVIHARRGEVYTGLYNGQLQSLEAERHGPLTSLVPSGVEMICQEPWPELLASGLPFHVATRPLAGMVAVLALADGGVDPAAIDANYVRRSDADGRWHDG